MAKTGVKKYDDLPSRLEWNDVDAIRAGYSHEKWLLKKVKNFSKLVIKHLEKKVKKTEHLLDQAVERHEKLKELE